jgi:hypothetical protein
MRVDSTGIEPVSLPCEGSIFPLDDEPRPTSRHRRESNPPESDRQSPGITRYLQRRARALDENRTRLKVIDSHLTSPDVSESSSGPHGDSNPDLTRCKRGVLPFDDGPRRAEAAEEWKPRDSNPDFAHCKCGVFPLDDGPRVQKLEGEVGFEPTTSTVQSRVFYR